MLSAVLPKIALCRQARSPEGINVASLPPPHSFTVRLMVRPASEKWPACTAAMTLRIWFLASSVTRRGMSSNFACATHAATLSVALPVLMHILLYQSLPRAATVPYPSAAPPARDPPLRAGEGAPRSSALAYRLRPRMTRPDWAAHRHQLKGDECQRVGDCSAANELTNLLHGNGLHNQL